MRRIYHTTLTAAVLLLGARAGAVQAQDASRSVADGGITVKGWQGTVDPKEAAAGRKLTESKLAAMGKDLHVVTGPAVTYWNPANKASGDYTVKATFSEPKYMSLNSHPHPYGIMIGGNDMGTPDESYLYCAAYGNGSFIVRGFGPVAFQMNGRGAPAASVHKAAGPGSPVTQDIAVTVKGDKVSCSINGAVVAEYDKAALVSAGKLKSTDGIYGVRFAHNTEGMVSGLTMTKN
jgi:hypothetical protein